MESYTPEHFQNYPERGFWQVKIIDKAIDIAATISKNLVVFHAVPTERSENDPADLIILQHKLYPGSQIVFPFDCTQGYFENKLEKDLRQHAKNLIPNNVEPSLN
ncbi:MAG: hypothetical protein KBC22_00035 [Candidatus Pacebacteria bacterium]|nr:hypothetical protein [Candidatus Paceibacterota bacterium]